jgi:3-hydroxyacyl-CoA dehydrogenase/enoyl-CoA hydratase/3-hydroxybutyryl-CoA epimerase
VLLDAFGARMSPSTSLQRVVQAGRTGRKGKRGFYLYDASGRKGAVDESVYELMGGGSAAERKRAAQAPAREEIVERCVLAMVNEAARCLSEGILRSARDGDVGAVFGIGFPPFRGGPFRYVDRVGADAIVQQLDQLNGRFPPRFEPAPLLVDMARSRRRFYPAAGNPLA